ncbi:MAG: hypothetical protein AAFR44_02180, partial [Pseudomonadota bacterium]
MSIVNAPYPPEALLSPTRLIDHVDPEPLVANQAAYVLLAVEGPDIDPQAFGKAAAEASEIAQAYAALLTLAASVVAAEAPAMAAFWADSWRLVPPERLVEVSGIGPAVAAELRVVTAAAERLARTRIVGRPAISGWSALIDYCSVRRCAMAVRQ